MTETVDHPTYRVSWNSGTVTKAVFGVASVLTFLDFYLLTGSGFVAPAIPAALSVAFWVSLFAFVAVYPLRRAFREAYEGMRSRRWLKALFPSYVAVHLLIYGFVLEEILQTIFGLTGYSVKPTVFFSLGNYAFYPHNLWNTLYSASLNPSVVMLVPPDLGAALGPFAVFSALVIGVLVVANLHRLVSLSGRFRRVGGSVALPTISVVAGASCCLSIPELIGLFSPAVSAVLVTPLAGAVLETLYFLLPLSVMVGLSVNLRALTRVRDGESCARHGKD